MAQERGWIKIHRQIEHNTMWTAEPFTRGQAWIDLLLLANYKDGYIYVRGNKIVVKRGQVGWSQSKLALRWKWSRKRVGRLFFELEEERQIAQQKNNKSSIITILNYDTYQSEEPQTLPHTTPQTTPQKHRRRPTNKNVKKERNVKNILMRDDFFDFWNLYDKKVGRPKAEKKWEALDDDTKAKIMDHVKRYVQAKPDKQYRKDPATYLHQEAWNDEIITRDDSPPRRQENGPVQEGSVSMAQIMQSKQKAMQREQAIRACGKCQNGFIYNPETNTAHECECQTPF